MWEESDPQDIFKNKYNDNWIEQTKKIIKWDQMKLALDNC